jgi:TonB family protein
MISLAYSVAAYLINSVWEVSLIGAAGWVASRLLKRLGSQAEHIVWVSTLMLAIVTPALSLWRWLSGVFYGQAGHGRMAIALVAGDGARPEANAVTLLSPSIILVLLGLYAVTVLYFAGRLGWSLYLTIKLVREAIPLALDADKERLWSRCLRALSVTDAVALSSTDVAGPVTISFRRPVLLLPSGFSEECSDDAFLAAIAHEGAHMRRRDFQKNLLYEMTSLAIAFHPVTWMVKSQITQTRELICDDVATEKLIDSRTYAESLIQLATMVASVSRAISFNAIGIFDANILEKRLMKIHEKKQRLSLFVRYGLIVPAALLLLSAAVGAGSMAVAIAPQASSQPYGQVYKVGKDVSAPKLISSVPPEFPQSAQGTKDKFEGTCLIGFVVDETGMPQDVHVVRSLQQDFDENAMKAVREYRFKPAMKAGEPVAVSLKVEVKFARF